MQKCVGGGSVRNSQRSRDKNIRYRYGVIDAMDKTGRKKEEKEQRSNLLSPTHGPRSYWVSIEHRWGNVYRCLRYIKIEGEGGISL